jgi:NDP-4-keto-2,6-dideoxyhexose 3-C-methyltransferase
MIDNRKIKNIKKCRLCGKRDLREIIDFGMMSLPLWPILKEDGVKAPLKFMVCPSCSLGQLAHSINRESFFLEYWYRTGINNTMRSHMADLAKAITKEVRPSGKDVIIDVGANDGTLLSNYKKGRLIGFEPSNLCPKEKKSGTLWINDFFDSKLLSKNDRGSVLAFTTIAMFYYLDNPVAFAEEIKSILSPNGIWVSEMTYALDLIQNLAFDFINHEHVTIWSAGQFKTVVQKAGLEIFRIERNSLNGGSIRFWVGRPGHRPVEPSVSKILRLEEKRFTLAAWRKFAQKVRKSSQKLKKIVVDLNSSNKSIMVYGASTRGLTLLDAAGLNSRLIEAAVEKSADKVGRYYGTTKIPVISEDEMRSKQPDALLILPYSFINEFVKREKVYLEQGGVFIVPLPEPKIVTKSSKEAVK